jgi:putative flippase GtrA
MGRPGLVSRRWRRVSCSRPGVADHQYRNRGAAVTQIIRYAIVGVLSNISGYLGYLFITSLGVGPKAAMTGLYVLGAGVGFFGHRKWSFSHRGAIGVSLARYGAAHLLGYALNLTLLLLFVDWLGFPHRQVQGAAICFVAAFLFLTFRFFVFPQRVASQEQAR